MSLACRAMHSDQSKERDSQLPLRPVRSKKEKARKDGHEVIRMTHREAQERGAKDEKIRQ